jgi:hypothetical protein
MAAVQPVFDLDHGESMVDCTGQNLIQPAWLTGVMHRNNGLGM